MNEILDEKKKLTERSPLIAEFKKKSEILYSELNNQEKMDNLIMYATNNVWLNCLGWH